MRKLASIQKVAEIKPIPDADRIEAYRINGWWVVDQKGKYQVGDLVVYIEPDAWVPHSLAPFLCRGKEPREYNGIPGEKLRTIRLKKQLSQGLLLPVDVLPFDDYDEGQELSEFYFVGHNVTDMLGIQKWEPAENPHLAGQMKGYFPSFIPKTDQERCISSGTLIKTDKGDVPIETICDNFVGVNVLTVNHYTGEVEYKPVIDSSIMTRRKGWVRIRTKSGNVIVVTTNHKIWLPELGAYREAGLIKPGDKVLSY